MALPAGRDSRLSGRARLLVALSIFALAAGVFYGRIRHEMIDFVTWRHSVERALDAQPLYRIEDGHYQFKYLPLFALMMAPFGVLDEDTGKALWFAALVLLLVYLLRTSVSALPDRRLSRGTLLLVTFLLMAKFYAHELLLGQVNLPLGALLVAALVAAQHGRPTLAGALAGLAVFVKPYALILVPWLLVTQGWIAAFASIAVIAAGLLVPSVMYGWNGNLDLLAGWWRTVSDSTSPNLLGNDNVSIAAMWAKWLEPGPVASILATLTGVAALLLAVLAWQRRRHVAAPAFLECALLMLLIPLISPQGWDYVLLLATPAVACLVDRWRELTPPWRWPLAAALAVMGFTMFDIMGRALYGRFMALSLITVCALTLAAGLVHLRFRALA